MTELKRPFKWGRGPARLEFGAIVMDEVTPYVVESDEARVFALAGVRDPDDAVVFAEQYGMLHSGPRDARPLGERFFEWQQVAAQMTETISLVIELRRSQNGDASAKGLLRRYYDTVVARSSFYGPLPDGADVPLGDIADLIALEVNGYRIGVASVLVATETNGSYSWRFVIGANNLLGSIYQDLAELLVSGREMRLCVECGRPFLLTDPRRLFHNEGCAYRARRRRMLERKRERESGGAVDAGTARL